ncbi:hypothetical protein ACP3WD_25365, partial [Salmonella enterica]
MRVRNPSQSPAFNVSVRDLLPPELGYVAGSGRVSIAGADAGAA